MSATSLTVAQSGNVGIGSTTPQTALDVAGDATIAGSMSALNMGINGDMRLDTMHPKHPYFLSPAIAKQEPRPPA